MGAGKKVWGYYPAGDVWLPLQVDKDGKVVADMSGISLGDLSDTFLPAPGDQYFLYWDAASSKWTCRILVAADIPNLAASKITTGILNPAIVGPKIQDADGDTYLWVEKTADEDKIHGVVKGVEAFLIHDDGIIDYAKQSAARAHHTGADQMIPSGSSTKVILNTEDYDVQNEFDSTTNYRFTATKAGAYFMSGSVYFAGMPDGAHSEASLWLNGVNLALCKVLQGAAGTILPMITHVMHLDAGDFIELYAYQGTGINKWLTTAHFWNWLAIQKLA